MLDRYDDIQSSAWEFAAVLEFWQAARSCWWSAWLTDTALCCHASVACWFHQSNFQPPL